MEGERCPKDTPGGHFLQKNGKERQEEQYEKNIQISDASYGYRISSDTAADRMGCLLIYPVYFLQPDDLGGISDSERAGGIIYHPAVR